jgi:primosomal protein N' (replication factor Y)
VGSLVQVPFHGRLVRGWVLEPTDDVPPRMLSVKKVVSPVRFFDPDMLSLARWVSERYVAPLAAVLGRLSPPRVASEELQGQGVVRGADARRGGGGGTSALTQPCHTSRARTAAPFIPSTSALVEYRSSADLLRAIGSPNGLGAFVVRPAPEDEVDVAVEAVAACIASGRRVIVVVPEASPVPATAAGLLAAFGDRVGLFLGGAKRARYRMWLDIAAGCFDVVVGTRSAVFAPVRELGLILVSRESHPAHREDRAPYYHVRDVALARARAQGAVCVLEAVCASSETAAMGLTRVEPATRRWPPVEVVRPGPEGRAPRLVRALREVRRGFLFSPVPGSGIAAVCRTCGSPAACARCGGALRSEEGEVRCLVCEAPGRCASCGGADFGLRHGGAERVEEWASRAAAVPVRRLTARAVPRLPRDREVLVGGPDDVRDFGPGGLDLVGVLDADLAERRPGLTSRERAVTTWMEAIGWARPEGRAIVQATKANDPAIQSLVRGTPDRFHADERSRRAAAGFAVGSAVFRIAGSPGVDEELALLGPTTLLVSSAGEQTVCLLALEPDRVPEFGRAIRDLAARDLVSRVEAEPHL